jgi:hypothetical protein
MAFLKNNHGTVHFSLMEIGKNNKPKNLWEAMLRRMAKVTEKVWDTSVYCFYVYLNLSLHCWHFLWQELFSSDRSCFIATTVIYKISLS